MGVALYDPAGLLVGACVGSTDAPALRCFT